MASINDTKMHAGRADAVPGSDKAHAHSYAAHLGVQGSVKASSVNVGKQGLETDAIRQPPQDPQRFDPVGRRPPYAMARDLHGAEAHAMDRDLVTDREGAGAGDGTGHSRVPQM